MLLDEQVSDKDFDLHPPPTPPLMNGSLCNDQRFLWGLGRWLGQRDQAGILWWKMACLTLFLFHLQMIVFHVMAKLNCR